MSREMRRYMEKEEQDDRERRGGRRRQRRQGPRTTPAEFTREVRTELRKVVWPTRQEVVTYTIVVLITIVIMTGVLWAIDSALFKAVFALFD
jgi:preprotein translocase subunit SecE